MPCDIRTYVLKGRSTFPHQWSRGHSWCGESPREREDFREKNKIGEHGMRAAVGTATTHPLVWVPTGYITMALTYNMLTAAAVVMFSNLGMDNAKAAEYASVLGIAYTIT